MTTITLPENTSGGTFRLRDMASPTKFTGPISVYSDAENIRRALVQAEFEDVKVAGPEQGPWEIESSNLIVADFSLVSIRVPNPEPEETPAN